jgi:type II secretory pathway component PulM
MARARATFASRLHAYGRGQSDRERRIDMYIGGVLGLVLVVLLILLLLGRI